MKNINVKSINKKCDKIPYYIVFVLMLFLAPIGVWIFVEKKKTNKNQLYNRSRTLTGAGLFIAFLIGIGIYSKIKDIIVLYESGMSWDMINFIPENICLYGIGIIMCVSYFWGGKKLMNQSKTERIYIKNINIQHEDSIEKISNKLDLSVQEVKTNIILLQQQGYLIPIEIDNQNNKIVYLDKSKGNKKILNSNKTNRKVVTCKKCGTIVSLKSGEYIECDFCGNGLIEAGNN